MAFVIALDNTGNAILTMASQFLSLLARSSSHAVLLLVLLLYTTTIRSTSAQASDTQGLKFVVVEEGPVDELVGSVSYSDIILDRFPEAERSDLRYSIQAKDDRYDGLFKVGAQSGNITVAQNVDREKVCPWTDTCVLQFDAIVLKTGFFEKIPVSIDIADTNDNAPTFDTSSLPSGGASSPPVFEVRFPESSPVGSVRPLLTATDADMSSAFGVQNYSLDPQTAMFSVEVTKNAVGTPQVDLVLKDTLDRETDASYTLTLVARDGGDSPLTGSLNVRVLVDDFNDNEPVFTKTFYSANFSETEGKGYEIVKVKATDIDEGKNGQVVYALSPQQDGDNPESILDKVAVDPQTGSVTLLQPLSSGTYRILVEARDQGDSQRVNQAAIYATVLDTDNNQPVVRLLSVPQAGDLPEGWVSESEPPGQVVGYLTVEDPDSGNNGDVSCHSLEEHFKLEQLPERGSYKLVLSKELDYETASRHIVEAVCMDQGSPSLNASGSLVIEVADENDNEPIFTKSSYEVGIFENNVIGDTVVVVTATDKDSGERGKVEYRLLPGAGSNFTISPQTGVVRATISFDREKKDRYNFTVLAVDGGSPAGSATASVTITVRDKNDVPPVFGRPSYRFSVYENRNVDSVVGNITVADPDLLDGGQVTLSLVFDDGSNNVDAAGLETGTDNAPFSITDEGKIFSHKVFDREEQPSYTFYIVATDKGQRRLSSSVEAVVEILDENDHRPTFSFPSEQNFSALANIPIRGDQSVLRVDVSDSDVGKNGIVSYSIVATNASAGLFRIGKFTGEIVATRDIGRSDLGTFFITVNASDQGSPPLWENRTLHLVIQAEAAGSANDVIADQNVLIVVCIVCFTVIVSGGVFIALCVLRRLDRQRKLQYAASCCPGNRPAMDVGSIPDPGTQQYDLAPPGGKDPSPKHNGSISSPYHQHPQSHPGSHHHKDPSNPNLQGGDASDGHVFGRGPHAAYGPGYLGGRVVPLSSAENKKNIAPPAPQRLEDLHSTSSTETAAGDSGHGSDEEFSNSLDHSTAPPPPAGSSHAYQAATSSFKPAAGTSGGSKAPNVGGGHFHQQEGASSLYPLDASYTSMSSSLRGGQNSRNPGGSSVRSTGGKVFPSQGRGSSSSSKSGPPSQQQQQFSMTALPPQRRKNSSVRFHPLVTDISEQAGPGQTVSLAASRSGHNGSSSSVSGYATGTTASSSAPPPPPPPSRHPNPHHQQQQHQQQPPHHQNHQQQIQQPAHHRPMSQRGQYPKQHSLLPPLSNSSSSSASSPLDMAAHKHNVRLSNPVGGGGGGSSRAGRQAPQLSPLSRASLGHEAGEESDLNTTTSGSYSVASDDVGCRLNDFGDTADAYV